MTDHFTASLISVAERDGEHEVPSVDISELKQKSVAELHQLAQELNITNYSGLRKQDLIFRIEQSLLDKDTVIRGEGWRRSQSTVAYCPGP